MAELNTISLSDFTDLADRIFIKGADSVEPAMINSGLVKQLTISKNTGSTRKFTEIDDNEYLSYKGEGDQASRAKVQQGYTKTMTKYRVAENVSITYEMRDENKYPEVTNKLLSGGRKGPNTIDLDLSHRITFGGSEAAGTYTDRDGRTISTLTGDGQYLFDTDHSLAGSTTTFRNRLANNPALSKGALEAMEKQIVENTYNHLGEKKVINFDTLWIGDDPNTKNTAMQYLKSVADPDATHNGVINPYQGKYKLVIIPRLATTAAGATDSTKAKYWGLASSMNSSFYIGIWEAPHLIAPSAGSNGEDVQTDDWDFRIRAGYGITIVGANWIHMSSGNGVA
jgi:hypothetical protein